MRLVPAGGRRVTGTRMRRSSRSLLSHALFGCSDSRSLCSRNYIDYFLDGGNTGTYGNGPISYCLEQVRAWLPLTAPTGLLS